MDKQRFYERRILMCTLSRLLIVSILIAVHAVAQGPYPFTRAPLNVTNIPNITSANVLDCAPAIGIIDNRSTISRTNDFHGFSVVATGIWTASLNYSDSSCAGPWTSFGSMSSLSNSSPSPWIGFGEGYHAYLQFVVTGNATVTYGGTKNMFYPAVSSGAQFPITWTGAWSALTNYTVNDIVSYNGGTYISLVANSNVTPVNGATWQTFIPGGATGSASGDLCGSFPSPTVCGIGGVSIALATGILKLTTGFPSIALPGTDYVGSLPVGVVLGNGSATGSGLTATGGSQALVSNPSNTGYLFSIIPGVGATGSQTQYLRITPNSGNTTSTSYSSLPTLLAADYAFPNQTPGGSIGSGLNVITVSPVPLGVNGTDVNHGVYVSGGAGTAESCLISGGTAVSGNNSGTLIINCNNPHTGPWTVGSGNGGIAEAAVALGSTGGTVQVPAGIIPIHSQIYLPEPSPNTDVRIAVRGVSITGTQLVVAADFPTTVGGVFIGPTGNVGFGPEVGNMEISFTEPDSTSLGSYTQWPAAFNMNSVARSYLHDLFVVSAWDVVTMTGNSGGTIIDNLQASFFDKGIQIDGSLDSVYLKNVRFWPYKLTANQQTVFSTNSNVYGLYSARMDDLNVVNFFSEATNGIYLYTSAGGSTAGHMSNVTLDTTSNYQQTGGNIAIDNMTVTEGIVGSYPGITINGSSSAFTIFQLTNGFFGPGGTCTGTNPYISIVGQNNTTVQISNSWFWSQACDISSISSTGGADSTTVIALGNWFNRLSNTSYTRATINVAAGSGRLTAVGNRSLDKGSNTGNFFAIASDDFHQLRSNSAVGWHYSFPTCASNTCAGVYETDMTMAAMGSLFVNLPTPTTAGTFLYCSNCTTAATCVGGGSGHMAVWNGSIWTCN